MRFFVEIVLPDELPAHLAERRILDALKAIGPHESRITNAGNVPFVVWLDALYRGVDLSAEEEAS